MTTGEMTKPPEGTFMAKVRKGHLQLPPPVRAYCEASGWNLFAIRKANRDHLLAEPLLPENGNEDVGRHCASLSADGVLWIPGELRETVELGEQDVMVRVENGGIGIYLRKVFETIGFRP